MQRCPECSRHVWETERRCPFCAAPLRVVVGAPPFLITALIGLTMFACTGDDSSGETTTGEAASATMTMGSSGASMSSTSGPPTTSEGSGSSSSASSTSASGSTSTSATTSATTGSSSTGGETDTLGTSSGSTTDPTTGTDTDTDTGGACDGPGEAVCDGVCVNTDQDSLHCGMCFNACDADLDLYCSEGECVVIIPPYGAPMPEPLWV